MGTAKILKAFSRALLLALCLTISAAAMVVSLGPDTAGDSDAVVAVFPLWWSADRTFVAAGEAGSILNTGKFPFVVVVQSKGADLGERLRAAGAILLLDPLGLGGCLENSARKSDV